MIEDKCFSEEWLQSFKDQPEHRRIDIQILEKMIYALHLLGRLQSQGLSFVFKGGTSLILLLDKGNRFSIDIDIICSVERTQLESILDKVIDSSRFSSVHLDKKRSYQTEVPKAHYRFNYISSLDSKGAGTILLDVLIEEPLYPKVIQVPIATKWISSTSEVMVSVPSIDAITGDKLTAFAPNTVGIPYYKSGNLTTMEVIKQLYDVSQLFERISDIKVVAASYNSFVSQEISYRDPNLTREQVLRDTIDACAIIARRGNKVEKEEKARFALLQKGIRSFGSGYVMYGSFRIDDAVSASGRVAYLAAKLLKESMTPLNRYTGQGIKEMMIEQPQWNALNRLKRYPDKSAFFYWRQAILLLEE